MSATGELFQAAPMVNIMNIYLSGRLPEFLKIKSWTGWESVKKG
jgi:hypothetical protein